MSNDELLAAIQQLHDLRRDLGAWCPGNRMRALADPLTRTRNELLDELERRALEGK